MNDTTNQQGLSMLEAALALEEKGYAFYRKALTDIRNPLGHDMIEALMKDELMHMERIQAIAKDLKSGSSWSEGWRGLMVDKNEIAAIFNRMTREQQKAVRAESSDIDALDLALDLEQESITFYEDSLRTAGDPIERAFLTQIVEEEKKHHSSLEDIRLYLTDPQSWFTEHEHHGLDGA